MSTSVAVFRYCLLRCGRHVTGATQGICAPCLAMLPVEILRALQDGLRALPHGSAHEWNRALLSARHYVRERHPKKSGL